MAAVNEVLSGDDTSASFTPTDNVSDVIVDGNGGGKIYLEALQPSGSWVLVTDQTGVFSISTADPAILYRFRSVGLATDVRVYIGP